MSGDIRWSVGAFDKKQWGEESVVYNQRSGQTHLLNSTSTRVLAYLEQEPLSVLGLTQKLAADTEVEADEELVRHVESLLLNLEAMGLIEPVAS